MWRVRIAIRPTPLMEVCDNLRIRKAMVFGESFSRDLELADEMRDHVTEDAGVVGFYIEMGDANTALFEQLLTELIQLPRA
jgi:hypothetical protein